MLGDNLVVFPDAEVTDSRMDELDLAPRRAYQGYLAAGGGYDETLRSLLKELQTEQAERRNRPGGYWIAEADPSAAEHAVQVRRTIETTPWAVMSTDGAYNTMRHLGLSNWDSLIQSSSDSLAELLGWCRRWEAENDPSGEHLPRAKRHDDKSIAVVRFDRG